MNKSLQEGHRILFLVPYTYPEFSGSGIHAINFARFLSKSGEKPTILTLNRMGRYSRTDSYDNLIINRLLYYNHNIVTKLLSLFFILPGYIQAIFKHDLILIYGAHMVAWELAIILSLCFNKKVVFQSLLMDEDDLRTIVCRKSRLLQRIYRHIFRMISAYHAINPEFSRRFLESGGNEHRLIQLTQGVDAEIFAPHDTQSKQSIKERLGLSGNRFLILSIGFVIDRKGYEEIFEVLAKLSFPFQYVIIGEYNFSKTHFLRKHRSEAEKIIKKGEELLGDKLIILGALEDVTKHLQAADLFLMNSLNEGTPNALLEAMSASVPVACSDLAGIKDFLIKDGINGYLFSNSHTLENIIRYIYQNQEEAEKIAKNGRKSIVNHAGFNIIWTTYKQYLKLS